MALTAAALTLLADQASKAVVRDRLSEGRVVELAGGALKLVFTRNKGAAFSLLQSGGWFFTMVALVVAVGILVYLRRSRDRSVLLFVGLGLILGGALGNLLDRVRLSYVVDFIDLGWWPVFNIADSAIVAGVAALVLKSLRDNAG